MKKRVSLLLAIFLNISYFCYSQQVEGKSPRAQALQVAYLTKELSLTPDEAQKLWPVYNNYLDEIRAVRKDKGDDPIETEEKVLNIRKKYKDDFKRVLGSEDRVNKLFVAEKNFREILRKELLRRGVERED